MSIGQSSSHWPQFTQVSEIWANLLMWNIGFGGTSPEPTMRDGFFRSFAFVKQTGQFSMQE
jgi:hypothetical protein